MSNINYPDTGGQDPEKSAQVESEQVKSEQIESEQVEKNEINIDHINNPHDKYVRGLLQNPKLASELFSTYADQAIQKYVDLDALQLQKTSFITDQLKEYFSDLVYQCPFLEQHDSNTTNDPNVPNDKDAHNDPNNKAKIILLVEHQSTRDQNMPFRIFHYIFNLLNIELSHLLKTKQSSQRRLPPFYAFILYNGKQSLDDAPTSLLECFNDRHGIVKKMLTEPLKVVDVNQLSEKTLAKQKTIGLIAESLKYRHRKDPISALQQILPKLAIHEQAYSLDISKLMIQYLFSVGGSIPLDQVKALEEFIKQISEPLGDKVMTIAEQLTLDGFNKGREEGRAEGKEEGRAEGIEKGRDEEKYQVALKALKNGISFDAVIEITGLTKQQVISVQQKLNK